MRLRSSRLLACSGDRRVPAGAVSPRGSCPRTQTEVWTLSASLIRSMTNIDNPLTLTPEVFWSKYSFKVLPCDVVHAKLPFKSLEFKKRFRP